MSLKLREKRINLISKKWKLKKAHSLITRYKIEEGFFEEFKFSVKLYISKALNITYEKDDKLFIKNIDKARKNRTNITPNGAVVPKREYHLEYNIVIRNWCELVRRIIEPSPKLLKLFRITPNIRIKFGDELKDNKNRGLSTSLPHSDAWVEGPWGMNCFIPFFGDIKNNNLKYYEPKKGNFKDEFLRTSSTYKRMQWVMNSYKPIKNFYPKSGYVNISDYASVHNTERKKNCGTRVSIDTTFFVGNYLPHRDRLKEYTKTIPDIGITKFIDSGQYQSKKFVKKISTFSHYTSKVLRLIKF